MTNDQMFYFKDVDAIIGKRFKYVMMRTKLEMQNCDGREVVVMKVMMAGFDENNKQVFLVSGCPCPPCKPAVTADLDRLFL
jgi:hypothetical protein